MTAQTRSLSIDWTSDNPHLSGNFAPIGAEIDAPELTVISGRIPEDLSGVYMRNGPNPRFRPASYIYPLEGDGMVHAVFFDAGRARYRNRFVRTRSFMVEDQAGHAVYGGIMDPTPLDPAALGSVSDPFKQSAFIGVIQHGERLLALGEAEPAWELSMGLETLGPWTAGTGQPLDIGAHTRVHPVTGDLFGLTYDALHPAVHIHRIGPHGRLLRSFEIALAAPSMIHDFILTELHIVLLIGPAVFDMEAARRGESFIQWRPEIGTRIAVMDLDGGATRWIEAEAFFVFHFANGFERGSEIVIDYVRHERLSLGHGGAHLPPTLHRLTIDLLSMRMTDTVLFGSAVEFPRIDDRRIARSNRFIYLPTLTPSLGQTTVASATFNCLLCVDTETGKTRQHDFGHQIAGEAVFIPRGAHEQDGCVASFLYDPVNGTSDFVLLDAARIDAEPVAVIRMPQRVPQGLHGAWISP